MSGDEEANDVIVQIIEAAKKGDEQALKVVALIKQLTQSNSDQAEEGAEENTEVMKCGGKVRAKMKAKKGAEKKEEGGEIPEAGRSCLVVSGAAAGCAPLQGHLHPAYTRQVDFSDP